MLYNLSFVTLNIPKSQLHLKGTNFAAFLRYLALRAMGSFAFVWGMNATGTARTSPWCFFVLFTPVSPVPGLEKVWHFQTKSKEITWKIQWIVVFRKTSTYSVKAWLSPACRFIQWKGWSLAWLTRSNITCTFLFTFVGFFTFYCYFFKVLHFDSQN